mmetsp:Transcript_84087/g.223196  ORF Transcript_84087/g.223196 Transcript_84087/m.223196 type:complete len:90 (-) Transcript_84087:1024-1293(-)
MVHEHITVRTQSVMTIKRLCFKEMLPAVTVRSCSEAASKIVVSSSTPTNTRHHCAINTTSGQQDSDHTIIISTIKARNCGSICTSTIFK